MEGRMNGERDGQRKLYIYNREMDRKKNKKTDRKKTQKLTDGQNKNAQTGRQTDR